MDDIDKGGDSLTTLAVVLVAAGVLRLVFSVIRRLVAGRVSLGVEFNLRNLMYSHLQSLELGVLRLPADGPADVARHRGPVSRCASSSATG